MSVAFKRGQQLGQEDLKIAVRDQSGNLFDPSVITYSVFDYTTGVDVLIGNPNMVPASNGVGLFYANTGLPLDANIGEWVVRWNMKQVVGGPIVQVVQRFAVVSNEIKTDVTQDTFEQVMMRRLRILLRDNNPDRNYRFRPPNTEKFLQAQTETMGYVFTDDELYETLLMSVDQLNMWPPVEGYTLSNLPDRYRTCVLQAAAAHACRAVTLNWIADEFSIIGSENVVVRDGTQKEYTLSMESLFRATKAEYFDFVEAQVREFLGEDGWSEPYEATYTGSGANSIIGKAFHNQTLSVRSVNPVTGDVSWQLVEDVCKHITPGKGIYKVGLTTGHSVTCTEDHSLFTMGKEPGTLQQAKASSLAPGDSIAACRAMDFVQFDDVTSVEKVPDELCMYDLCVLGNENFVLASGVVAHNTYSISGVSLDIDKSSKYQGMADVFEQVFEKLIEPLKRSVKHIRGLQQPRYGIGISSALGPFSRVGTQSRSNYISGSSSWS